MRVDDGNHIRVCNRDVIRLDAHKLAIFLVGFMNSFEASATTALVQQPEVGESGKRRTRNVTYGMGPNVGEEVVEKGEKEKRVGCEEEREIHFGLALGRWRRSRLGTGKDIYQPADAGDGTESATHAISLVTQDLMLM